MRETAVTQNIAIFIKVRTCSTAAIEAGKTADGLSQSHARVHRRDPLGAAG